ncbi:MAG TPA: hypothetical protein VM118_00905 [Acidobacteriota bacterium]|nr:hypothetical protein [Acidobacteriota bacterium]
MHFGGRVLAVAGILAVSLAISANAQYYQYYRGRVALTPSSGLA